MVDHIAMVEKSCERQINDKLILECVETLKLIDLMVKEFFFLRITIIITIIVKCVNFEIGRLENIFVV